MNSIWTENIELPQFPKLEGGKKTHVLIIGGGMAGILCAYILEQAGVDYLLVEADTICSGITKNTTAKITSQHGLVYSKLLHEFGSEKARLYLQANEEALEIYRKICGNIDCDFETKENFVYSINHPYKLEKEIKALEKIGSGAKFTQTIPLPFQTAGAVKFENQAQFHPLKFIAAIAPELNIYEHTKVTELGIGTALTERGEIRAEHIIVATHYPINNKHGAYFLKLYQSRSYVLGLKHAPQVNGMYVDEAEKGLSFRSYQDIMLLGGGSHRTGKKGGKWQELCEFAEKYYPEADIEYNWAAQDCMSLDKVPYIGLYGKHTKGFYVASGFNKWGMTSAMVSARLLLDYILERENPYMQLFYPHRTVARKQLFINMAESTVDVLSISKHRCPHMGCALKWNPEERSWDCPCHGSRFTEKGELIDNPATGDLKE